MGATFVPPVVIAALEWARPWGLAALILPILVLLSMRYFRRAPRIASGVVDLWEETAPIESRGSTRRRPRVPLSTWLLCSALVFGAAALAGPRLEPRRASFRCVVDRTPSMYLAAESGTRLSRAVALAETWIGENVRDADEVQWCDAVGTRLDCVSARDLPRAWLTAPRIPRAEIVWPCLDAAGTLWITDRKPADIPYRAGVIASGGALVRGVISATPEHDYEWGENGLVVEVAARAPRGTVALLGARELPAPLRGVLDAWAHARAMDVVDGDAADARLSIHTVERRPGDERKGDERTDQAGDELIGDESALRRVTAGRDGWSATGEVGSPLAPSDADGDLEVWLALSTAEGVGHAIVRAAPGRIVSAWTSMEDPRGDPAAFAVSWATLFDSVVLPAPHVVSAEERADAGGEFVHDPIEPAPELDRAASWDAWLACAASAAVLAAWIARGRGTSSGHSPRSFEGGAP